MEWLASVTGNTRLLASVSANQEIRDGNSLVPFGFLPPLPSPSLSNPAPWGGGYSANHLQKHPNRHTCHFISFVILNLVCLARLAITHHCKKKKGGIIQGKQDVALV